MSIKNILTSTKNYAEWLISEYSSIHVLWLPIDVYITLMLQRVKVELNLRTLYTTL